MRFLLVLVIGCSLISCASDAQIVGIVKNQGGEDSAVVNTVDDGPGEDSSVDSAELVLEGIVGYTHYSLQQVACPECVGSAQEITLNFSALFHEPITDSHTEWIPSPGTCIQNLQETVPSTNPIDVGAQITITGPVHSFSAQKYGTGYQTSNIYETQYDRDSIHTVGSTVLYDEYEFVSTRGFDYIEPAAMLYVDMSYAYQAPIYRSGASFYWGPSGSEENFMIIVAVYTSNGASLIGYTTCVSQDVGYLTIPSTYLSSYPPGSLVAIHLSRQAIELVPSYDLGGYVESHMEWEVVGTGYIE